MTAVFEWLANHQTLMWAAAGLSLGSLLVAAAALPFFVVRLPVDYFVDPRSHFVPHRHPYLALAARVVRNLVGVLLVIAGLAMLVLPGQGLLTLVVGLTLVEFPGKFQLERALVRRGPILRILNWMRARRGVPPLHTPPAAVPSGDDDRR